MVATSSGRTTDASRYSNRASGSVSCREAADEILSLVNIALGNAEVASCEAGDANLDGQITIDEILTAVSNALTGCG